MKKILILLLLLIYFPLSGQIIDHTASYRNISSDKYVRLHYENDFFSETDRYYTQGMNLEFVHPVISSFPFSVLVPKPKTKLHKTGLAIEHLGFTPNSISESEIIAGDRPFAATLFLKTFSVISDSIKNYRFISVLSTGVIGPAAGGEQIQQQIHKWLGNVQPQGWKYQIQNDLVLNYQLDLEKKLMSLHPYLLLNGKGGAMIGTLFSKAYAGMDLMLGVFDSPYSSLIKSKKKYKIHFYTEPMIHVVGYDATLQGGVFNRDNPYTIPSSDITRLLFQNNFGFVFKLRRLYLEYFQSFITGKYKHQGTHRWGGIRIGYAF